MHMQSTAVTSFETLTLQVLVGMSYSPRSVGPELCLDHVMLIDTKSCLVAKGCSSHEPGAGQRPPTLRAAPVVGGETEKGKLYWVDFHGSSTPHLNDSGILLQMSVFKIVGLLGQILSQPLAWCEIHRFTSAAGELDCFLETDKSAVPVLTEKSL
jgi:hypothetical protein